MRCLAVLVALTGCVATVAPRFPDDVGAALAEHDMRRLETARLVVYYPEARKALALRAAERIAHCQAEVEKVTVLGGWAANAKPYIVMPELPMNNAFVIPRLNGYERVSVVATHHTLDFATPFGLPPDPGAIGCHEIVHAVQESQMGGIWSAINRVFGEVLSPQGGLDAWFWEGLATYYEGILQPGMGRLAWPAWRGVFAAGYAGGDLDGDDLSELKRLAPPGHHYLVGSHFVEWLATKYGADQLWQVIATQGTSTALAFDINGRFKRVYGRSLSSMIDLFAAHVRRELPPRVAPDDQFRIREIGTDARYARAPDGTEAVVAEALDVAPYLEVRGPDGKIVWSKNLIDVLPPRQLVTAAPLLVSGMSFTDDARWLYLTVIDVGATYQIPRLLRLDVVMGELEELASGLGPGGAVAPDGTAYWILEVDGDAWGLAEYDLATKRRRTVIAPEPGRYVLKVAPSPSGERLALSRWNGAEFVITVVDRQGAPVAEIANGAGLPVYDASFVDDDRIVYLSSVNKRFQVMVRDLATGAEQQLTDAPYTALEPRAAGGTVRFLDREGWRWDLAEVALPAEVITPAPEPMTTDAPPGAPGSIPVSTPLRVLSDRPYSLFDNFFTPQLRGIALTSPSLGAALFGVALAGGDRLGYQRWAVTGYANVTPKPVLWSWSAGYRNSMLAPWWLTLEAQDLRWHHPIDSDVTMPGFETFTDRAQLDVTASLGRIVRGSTLISLDGVYTRDRFDASDDGLEPARFRRMGGAGATLAQDSIEATRYGGVRRRLGVATSGVYYPAELSTFETDLVDLRGQLALTIPMPRLLRHRVDVSVVGRGVLPRDDRAEVPALIEVGGAGPLIPLYQDPDPGEVPAIEDELLPAHVRFEEPLRGFEDRLMPARRALLATARWRYPIILDRGWATFLYYLPAVLIRELDLDVFGSAAFVDDGGGGVPSQHFAVGASATLSLSAFRVPLLVQYQISRRLSDDEALGHLVAVGLPLSL